MDSSNTEQAGKTTAGPAGQMCSPIVELRQYTLHPGQRDALIALFERAFIEGQEAAGIAVLGQFRDLGDPDRFVWLRGFPDMDRRQAALQAFYEGPVWQAHREAANALIADSDDVLLLRPARPTSGFWLDPSRRPPPGAAEVPPGPVLATILSFETPPEADVLDWFEGALAPALRARGASILASFVTEGSANTFPRLPVREGEHVFVWFAGFPDAATYDEQAAALAWPEARYDQLWEPVVRRLTAAPQVLRLAPTARSLVRG
jgi:hypothetical protein